MLQPRAFSFYEQLRLSNGSCSDTAIDRKLLELIPGALNVTTAHPVSDRNGTDRWIEHKRGTHLSVDIKNRTKDYGKDDLALEVWSVDRRIVGWTRDESKRTDFIFWWWQDTHRYHLVPFVPLCAAMQQHWQEWYEEYDHRPQWTREHGGYLSECVFVPRNIVWREMYKFSTGFLDPFVDDQLPRPGPQPEHTGMFQHYGKRQA